MNDFELRPDSPMKRSAWYPEKEKKTQPFRIKKKKNPKQTNKQNTENTST